MKQKLIKVKSMYSKMSLKLKILTIILIILTGMVLGDYLLSFFIVLAYPLIDWFISNSFTDSEYAQLMSLLEKGTGSFTTDDWRMYFKYGAKLSSLICLFAQSMIASTIDVIVTKLTNWFPILLDIRLDLDWLLLDFTRIIRTFFNLLQFILLALLARKIKGIIRKRFSRSQETDWSTIKVF